MALEHAADVGHVVIAMAPSVAVPAAGVAKQTAANVLLKAQAAREKAQAAREGREAATPVVADPRAAGQPASKMLHTELVATFEAGPIGAVLGDCGGAVKVLSVDSGSAAEAQGVCAGLIVCEVSGKLANGLDKRAVTALVKAARRPLQLKFSQDAEAAAETEAVPAAAGATAAHVESRQANCQPERCCGSSSCDRCGSSSESSCECAIAPAGSAAAAWAWSHRFVNEWDEDQEAACAAGVEGELQQAMEEIYDKHMAT